MYNRRFNPKGKQSTSQSNTKENGVFCR